MTDGIIQPDSARGKALGFTSDRFSGWLWKEPGAVIISFIESRQRGNFRDLVHRIHAKGWTVKVPTPLGRMQKIVRKNGYRRTVEPLSDKHPEPCEVWRLAPPAQQSR